MRKALTAVFMVLFIMGVAQAVAAEKTVKCQIFNNNKSAYKGSCVFFSEKSSIASTFSLSNPKKNKPLYDSISMISVYITHEKNVAEVRGLTVDGINSRWGSAKLFSKDKHCWKGEDFMVCFW